MNTIIVAKDFSDAPGGRYIKEGSYSGEEFREKILIPEFEKAKNENKKLLVDLDGTYGYATSFLDEAFGKLAAKYGESEVLEILEFKSEDQPGLIEAVTKYIQKHGRK